MPISEEYSHECRQCSAQHSLRVIDADWVYGESGGHWGFPEYEQENAFCVRIDEHPFVVCKGACQEQYAREMAAFDEADAIAAATLLTKETTHSKAA